MATSRPTVNPTPFPALSKSSSSTINGTNITATSLSFTDKLLITLSSPSGKLGHWVHVPLLAGNPLDPSIHSFGQQTGASNQSQALLPRVDLTATTVLGGTKREEEALGQTLAAMLGSAILHKRPQEERMLVMGLGLQGIGGEGPAGADEDGNEWFEEVVGLCLKVL